MSRQHKKRPFRNLYYDDTRADPTKPVTKGYAATEKGAIRGSVVRIFEGQHALTRVYHGGVLIYTIYNTKQGLQVHYGDASHIPTKVVRPYTFSLGLVA
jgi:hypothetical protein